MSDRNREMLKAILRLPPEKQAGKFTIMADTAQKLAHTPESEENPELQAILKAIAIIAQDASRRAMAHADAGYTAEEMRAEIARKQAQQPRAERKRHIDEAFEKLLEYCRKDTLL